MRIAEILRHPRREVADEADARGRSARFRWPSARVLVIGASIALLSMVALALVIAASHRPPRRRAAFPAATGQQAPAEARIADLPVEQWTARFVELERASRWETLAHQLDAIREQRAGEYQQWRLGYLHARARYEAGELDEAAEALAPFLAAGDPFRDLALYYRAQVADEQADHDEASRLRQQVIFETPQATYRETAVGEEAEHLQGRRDLAALEAFTARLGSSVDVARRRELEARAVELLQLGGDSAAAIQRGRKLLKDNLTDDPAERVVRALDRPELLERLGPEDWVMLGESARSHRHFDRAVELLSRALARLPARRDELLFSIGRSYFGAEHFAEAEKTYLQGAGETKASEQRATFYYHAARSAQLVGEDARAERHMGLAVASVAPAKASAKAKAVRSKAGKARSKPARGRSRSARRRAAAAPPPPREVPAAAAALTQRLRTRLAQKRWDDALSDLRLIRTRFSGDVAGDADLAYAVAMVATGRPADARDALQAVAVGSDKYAAAEAAYWHGRAEESADPAAAAAAYLRVLSAEVPTHFAYFARQRLADPPLAARVQDEVSRRQQEVERLKAAGDLDSTRQLQTEVVLLSPAATRSAAVESLKALYRELPRYREVLDLAPLEFPRLPLTTAAPDRLDLLLAMGLFDDAIDLVPARYPLTPLQSALTRSLALYLGSAPRASIGAVETLMKSVPSDYLPQLLPRTVRELLYPRYFHDYVVEQASKHGADPRLVLSIMREESRFDPRAKSMAAARGLLQFIITTAHEVGRSLGLVDVSSEDLYDPRIIIQLGAKYIADLLKEFGGDAYKAAAAYNAGPFQVRLWSRLSPDPGHDAFLSSVNFDETKNYVRKVLNSYERYGEIYEDRGPVGGLRVEP
jgi:soluble lytic murein transglycosylase-like protein